MFDSKIKSLQERLKVDTEINLSAYDHLLAFYQDNESVWRPPCLY